MADAEAHEAMLEEKGASRVKHGESVHHSGCLWIFVRNGVTPDRGRVDASHVVSAGVNPTD